MNKVVNTKENLIAVIGIDKIKLRRPVTVIGLSVKKVKALQKGETIKVNKSFYLNNKDIVKEVK